MRVFKERLKISLINVGKLVLFALAYLAVMVAVLLIAIYAYEAVIFLIWTAVALFALMILFLVIFYIYWQFIEPFKTLKKEGEDDEITTEA